MIVLSMSWEKIVQKVPLTFRNITVCLSIFSRPQLPVTSPDINIYREETKYEEDKEMS